MSGTPTPEELRAAADTLERLSLASDHPYPDAPAWSAAQLRREASVIEQACTGVTCTRVLATAATYYGRTVDALIGRDGHWPLVEQRQAAMYLCMELVGASSVSVAKIFDGRDHTTVLHARRKMSRAKGYVRRDIDRLRVLIESRAMAFRPPTVGTVSA